jgi:hypothetical protein
MRTNVAHVAHKDGADLLGPVFSTNRRGST